jgi:hypothetical protein
MYPFLIFFVWHPPPPKQVPFNSFYSDKCAVLWNRTENCISACNFFYLISVKKYQADFPTYVVSRFINMSYVSSFVRCLYCAPLRVITSFVSARISLYLAAQFFLHCLPTNCCSLLDCQLHNRTYITIRGRAFMLIVLARLTLWKNKK